jgi:hypothetical protein
MVLVYLSEASFLKYGLELVGFSLEQIDRMCHQVQLDNFVLFFGSVPVVMEKMWIDLQTTKNKQARLEKGQEDPMKFLMAHYFLKKYPRDCETPATFQMNRHSIRESNWYFIYKIQALAAEKLLWPKNWKKKRKELLQSTDGVHFWTREMPHPEDPYDTKYYSHKNKHAGLSYEIGVSLSESKIVWFSGPWPAGMTDSTIYKDKGLEAKIPATCAGVADGGYPSNRKGQPLSSNKLVTANSQDTEEVRRFKALARARHETLNKRLKRFRCLLNRFRHSPLEKHAPIFTAVCVIVQYQMDLGQPLFEI